MKSKYTLTVVIPSFEKKSPLIPIFQRGKLMEGENNSYPFEYLLGHLFKLRKKNDYPIAAVMALADGLQGKESYWLCADPTHLQTDMRAIYFRGNAQLNLTEGEVDSLQKSIQSLLPERCVIHTPHPLRWYLQMDFDPELITSTPSQVMHNDISAFLPTENNAMKWNALLTEIQMLLHAHPVNIKRREAHQPEINGIWLWGGGQLDLPTPKNSFYKIWADSALGQSFMHYFGETVSTFPNNALEIQKDLQQGDCLIIFEKPYAYSINGETENWHRSIEDIEKNWLSPLLKMLSKRDFAELVIYGDENCYHINKKNLRRWWW